MLHRYCWLLSSLLCTFTSLASCHKFPFQDPKLPWDTRVNDLVSRLTVDEMVNQSITTYRTTQGSVDRLGVPPYLFISECLHGYVGRNATAFPQSINLAATFSREVVYNMSEAVSYELRAFYNDDLGRSVHGKSGLSCFSPVINIMRMPLWGRNQETYGEDPYLSGELATAYVRGLQGNDPRYVRANAGCKHFAVYAGPENILGSRRTFDYDITVSERDLHMTFLPQFQACVDAGALSFMCSYSSLDGVPACANKRLLTDILRRKWNFTGYVVSDDDAIEFLTYGHHYAHDNISAVVAAISAGCNLELTDRDPLFLSIPQAIEKGLLTAADIAESVKPLIYTRMRLGDFDPPEMNPYWKIDKSVVLSPGHRELAIQAASMSFVLLKNINKYLPIKQRFQHLAIVGPLADNADALFGSYTAVPDRQFTQTPLEGLQRLSDDTRYAAGCDDPLCSDYNTTSVKNAVVRATFVIVCLGLGTALETEGRDRVDMDLPGNQLQILKDAIFYSREAPLVLLLFNAGPLDVTYAQESPEVDAIIACGYPAQSTGEALYRVLTATGPHSVPAGRLPATWPAQLNQLPPITDYNVSDGQTYRYMSTDPLYPFGYGLSYSKFHYTHLVVSPATITHGQSVSITVNITNRGPFDADEVVQVYLSWVKSAVPVPRWTLVGFQRVTILLGSTHQLSFIVTAQHMSVWIDDSTGFDVQKGDVVVYVGGQQPYQRVNVGSNFLQAMFTITA